MNLKVLILVPLMQYLDIPKGDTQPLLPYPKDDGITANTSNVDRNFKTGNLCISKQI